MSDPCDTRAADRGRTPSNTPVDKITKPVDPDDDIYARLGVPHEDTPARGTRS